MIGSSSTWHEYFQTVQYTNPCIARLDAEQGSVESNSSGAWLLYHWDRVHGRFQPLGPVVDMPFYEISPDGKWVFFLRDEKGNAFGHYVRRSVATGDTIDLTPDLPLYNAFTIIFSHNGDRAGFTWSTRDGFHACVLDLDADWVAKTRREIYTTRSLLSCPWLSADGRLALLGTNQFSGQMALGLLVIDVDSGKTVGTLWDGGTNDLHPMIDAPFSPIPGDPRLLTRANRSGLRRPVIWNPLSGERLDLAMEDVSGDTSPLGWSPDGKQILLDRHDRATQHLGIYDLESGSTRWLDLPGGVYGGHRHPRFGRPREIVTEWEDLSHPPQVVSIDATTGEVTPVLSGNSVEMPKRTWQPITFLSSDGQAVQAWLALPDGKGPFPTILETHGGPEGVRMAGYNPEALTWLDHGFAFVSVNYRGSTTFGKAFQDQIKGNFGYWELEDMAACRRFLVQQGIADPGKVFLTGYCYGGYLTLLALGKQPDLWCGGMAGGAIADWRMVYEGSTESGRLITRAYFNGSPEERPDLYRDRSPITYTRQVCVPVFSWMGEQDTHVTTQQLKTYLDELAVLGKPVEAIWYSGGHGGSFDVTGQPVDILARQILFVQQVLKGVYNQRQEHLP